MDWEQAEEKGARGVPGQLEGEIVYPDLAKSYSPVAVLLVLVVPSSVGAKVVPN